MSSPVQSNASSTTRSPRAYRNRENRESAPHRGQPTAAAVIYLTHSRRVFRFARRALGTWADAEDLTQEVFLRVFSSLPGLRDRDALKSFIWSIAIRTLKVELRRRRTRKIVKVVASGDLPEAPVPAVDIVSREGVARLYAILDRLTAQQRVAFVLRHIEHMSLDEIARLLGISLATVKRRLHLADGLVSREMGQDESLAPFSRRVVAGDKSP
jgi:RNA polymerase sigma-70 factor, ECF subfamily